MPDAGGSGRLKIFQVFSIMNLVYGLCKLMTGMEKMREEFTWTIPPVKN
jgi:hypothetical protein